MSDAKYKNITVQLEPETLVKVDEKAEAMDLNRSQYLRRLVRKDLGIPVPDQQPQPQEVAA